LAYTSTFKIVIFGDSQTGKTTLTHRFLTNLFKQDITMTLGVDFHLKALEVDGEVVKLQIWDFAGEERFRFLFPSYIRGASGAVFMYDITNYGSLAHVDEWFEIVEKEIDYKLPIIFVGGKTDLIHLKEVSTKKAMDLAINKGADGFIECSSKNGENINKIFDLLTKLILNNRNSQ
jgi:small GTP-binding protein